MTARKREISSCSFCGSSFALFMSRQISRTNSTSYKRIPFLPGQGDEDSHMVGSNREIQEFLYWPLRNLCTQADRRGKNRRASLAARNSLPQSPPGPIGFVP